MDLRLPGVGAYDLDQLRSGHARNDARDIVQELPSIVGAGWNGELIFEAHDWMPLYTTGRWDGRESCRGVLVGPTGEPEGTLTIEPRPHGHERLLTGARERRGESGPSKTAVTVSRGLARVGLMNRVDLTTR
jgi:hypothetical protein